MFSSLSQKLKNDLHLSLCFLALFTSLNTQSHIQKTLTVSIHEDDSQYNVDGFILLGIFYVANALGTWIAPCVTVITGMKTAMIIGAASFAPFVLTCYVQNAFFTYLAAAVNGCGAAIIWSGQAHYVILNSEVGNIYESISYFWLIYKCSYILGDALVYFEFSDPNEPVDTAMRIRITLLLLGFVIAAIILLSMLKPPLRNEECEGSRTYNLVTQIKMSYTIFTLKHFIILCELFLYLGIHISFLSVLGASMGFSEYLSVNPKQYAPLSGILQGIGEVGGACWCLYLRNKSYLKDKVILITGCLANALAYIIIFLTLPNNSVFDYTEQLPLVQLPLILLLLSNVLVGLGDACFQVETYQSVGNLYPNDGASAFAILNFFMWLAVGIGYFYSAGIGLHFQLTILISFLIITMLVQYWARVQKVLSQGKDELILYVNQNQNYNATELTTTENVDPNKEH